MRNVLLTFSMLFFLFIMGGCDKLRQFSLDFESNGGSYVHTETGSLAIPEAPTKEGSTFVGWFEDKSLTTLYDFTQVPKKSQQIKVYAKWKINLYSISFETNGGPLVADITQEFGSIITPPINFTKEGSAFAGWFTDIDLTAPYIFTAMPANNFTLYAKWSEGAKNQTISFATNGGSLVADITQVFGSLVAPPANPIKDVWTFVGWFTDIELITPYVFTTMPANDILLYAKWELKDYTIWFATVGGLFIPKITQVAGSVVVAPANPSKEGSTFVGWFGDSELTKPYAFTTMPNKDITVYAKWTLNSYTISFEEDGGSLVPDIKQLFGSTVAAPHSPSKEGSRFSYWFTKMYAPDIVLETTYLFTTMPSENITLYAKWIIDAYTIKFETNGGSTVPAIRQEFGSNVVAPANFSKEGSAFAGWFTDIDLAKPYIFTTMPANNITLYAKWTKNHYILSFAENGGSVLPNIEVEFGSVITAPVNFSKEYATFDDWYTDANLTTPYVFTTMPAHNVMVYAKWIENPYTISFETNGGSTVRPIRQTVGSSVTAPANFSKAGSTFAGWFTDIALTEAYVFTTMPANNITLYAKWIINNYTISFDTNGGAIVPTITQEFGSNVIAPTAPNRTEALFGGWFADIELRTPYVFTTMPRNNITLYAKWTVNSYTISFESNGGSTVPNIRQEFGSSVTAPANFSKTGFTFAGWFTDIALTEAYVFTTMPANNITLYAKWTVNYYTISFITNGGSVVPAITQAFGSSVATPASFSKEGSTFAGCFTDIALTEVYIFTTMPANNITLYAKWILNNYTISFDTNGGSTVPNITQAFGSSVMAPANFSKEGSTFAGWFTDIALITPYIFTTMPSNNITLYAKWILNSYTISFATNGGSVVAAITQAFGSLVASPANPTREEAVFAGWFTDVNLTISYIFTTMPSNNITLYAKWIINSYTISFITNGGTSIPNITQEFGSSIMAPANFSKTGFTFAGWFTDIALITPYIFTTMPAYNITLYAKWDELSQNQTISFITNGGSSVADITQLVGSAVTAPANPTRNGFTFAGWFVDTSLTTPYLFMTMPVDAITLYAKWVDNTNVLTVAAFKAGTIGATYWVRAIVVLEPSDDYPMMVADVTGSLIIADVQLPVEVGQEILWEITLALYEGVRVVYGAAGVQSYAVLAEGVANPLIAEAMNFLDFEGIDLTNKNNYGRYIELVGYVAKEEYFFAPLLTTDLFSGDYTSILPVYLMEPGMGDNPFAEFGEYNGYRVIVKGFLYPNFDAQEIYDPERYLVIAAEDAVVLDYANALAKINAIIAYQAQLLENTFFRPYARLELFDEVSVMGATLEWRITSLDPAIFNFITKEIQDTDTHQDLVFEATITIGSVVVVHEFTVEIYPYQLIWIEDFYNLDQGEYGKIEAKVARIIPGEGIILYNGHYLFAYGFPELNVGDEVTIFGVHEFSGGFIKMSGAAPHAYVTVDGIADEPSLYLYSTEAVANLALRNTYSGNILNYYAIIGRLVKQSGEYYLTDGLNTILLVLANPSLYATLAPFENADVEIKMFNYEYCYTEELWKAIVVAGDDIVETKVLSSAELTIILKDYIENDFNRSHMAGSNYSFSTTHPIYGGTIEVTVDPISSMYAVINGGELTLTPSDVQYTVTLQVEILCGVLHVTHTIEFDVSPGNGPPTN